MAPSDQISAYEQLERMKQSAGRTGYPSRARIEQINQISRWMDRQNAVGSVPLIDFAFAPDLLARLRAHSLLTIGDLTVRSAAALQSLGFTPGEVGELRFVGLSVHRKLAAAHRPPPARRPLAEADLIMRLGLPISSLGFQNHRVDHFLEAGLLKVQEVIDLTVDQLKKKGVVPIRIRELDDVLRRLGLARGMTIPASTARDLAELRARVDLRRQNRTLRQAWLFRRHNADTGSIPFIDFDLEPSVRTALSEAKIYTVADLERVPRSHVLGWGLDELEIRTFEIILMSLGRKFATSAAADAKPLSQTELWARLRIPVDQLGLGPSAASQLIATGAESVAQLIGFDSERLLELHLSRITVNQFDQVLANLGLARGMVLPADVARQLVPFRAPPPRSAERVRASAPKKPKPAPAQPVVSLPKAPPPEAPHAPTESARVEVAVRPKILQAARALKDHPVEEFGFSTRAQNCFRAEGIVTIRDLVKKSDDKLLRVRSFGQTTLDGVRAELARLGLRLNLRDEDLDRRGR